MPTDTTTTTPPPQSSSTPPPSAGSTPAPQGSQTPSGGDDPFSQLDSRVKGATTPPADKGKDKTGEGQAPQPPKSKDERTIKDPKMLREQYEKTSAELRSTREEVERLRQQTSDFEKRSKEAAAASEQLKALQKERDEYLAQLRAVRQEATPEFIEKYEKPYKTAIGHAVRMVEQLPFIEEDGQERMAKFDDFSAIYNAPLKEQLKLAKKHFGDGFQLVLHHLAEIRRLDDMRNDAKEEARTQAKKKEEEDLAANATRSQQAAEAWMRVNKDIGERNPEWFQAPQDDKEAQEILAKGYELVDSAFTDHRKKLSWQQQVVLDAHIRNRAAAFGYAQYQLSKSKAKIAELEGVIAEMKGSAPGAQRGRPSDDGSGGEKSWQDELRNDPDLTR